MRVDVFRRDEGQGKYSHLVVPHGKPIPQEATNYDWQNEESDIELDESAARWPQYGIESPGAQLKQKRYAITSLGAMTH